MNSAVWLLERAANKFPDKIAIEDIKSSITYREYRDLSRKIATNLLTSKYDDCPVVIFLGKNYKTLTLFMGARYSSRPYVPIDINMPVYRLQKIIDSLKPCVFITDKDLFESLKDLSFDNVDVKIYEELLSVEEDKELIDKTISEIKKEDNAYIIYTSGSTGIPKGAIRPDKGIKEWVDFVDKKYHFNSDITIASITPFYYEMSNLDVYYSIYAGAKLLIVPDVLLMHAYQLLEYIKEKEVNSMFSVPSVLINIANSGALNNIELPHLTNVMFSGEIMPNRQLNIWRNKFPDVKFTNIYGTSETSFICFYDIEREFQDSDSLPTGMCSDYLKMYLFKEDGTLARIGEEGELCLAGTTVSNKYWNNPENSKKAFVVNPLNEKEIIYKTGDNAYINEYGELCFRTRKDFQIKKHGHRIELGEIEHAAMNIDGVINAAAVYEAEKEEIILFIETDKEFSLHPFNVKLRDYIPSFMLPSHLVPMKKLFYKANGKMDRVKLKLEFDKRKQEVKNA